MDILLQNRAGRIATKALRVTPPNERSKTGTGQVRGRRTTQKELEFRARESGFARPVAACDEDLAVGQQRRRLVLACGVQAAALLKLKRSAHARAHERQPRTEKQQRERNPPRKNRAGRTKSS